MRKKFFCPTFCILLLCSISAGQVWLSGYKYRAELIVPEKKDSFPVEQAGTIKINCPAKEDGSDIRITDENGKVIDFFIARKGPGNFYEICFPANETKLFLFCGSSDVSEFQSGYRPKRGVLLEIYKLSKDSVDTVESCEKIIDESIKKENFVGATFRKNIFDASNPVTQSGYFLRVYTGYFYLNKNEKISFGTTSSGASLITVDEKLVASRPGRRWVENFIRPEYSGTVELNPGLHKLVYYHFEFPGWVYSVCAMKRENDTKFNVIDEDFFLPLIETKIGRIEKFNSPLCASFTWKNINYLYRERFEFITFQFTETSSENNDIVSWHWDFGDGQTSNERNPVHTYFVKKTYTVHLTVKDGQGNSDTVSMKVSAEQDYGQIVLNPRTQQQYLEEFKKFNLERLPDDELFALSEIYASYDEKEKEFECYSEILKRKIDLSKKIKIAFTAGELANQLKKYSEAEIIYQTLADEEGLPEAKLKLGQIYIETDQLDKAAILLNQVISDGRATEKLKRQAIIGLGDIARQKGDKKSALKYYESVTVDTGIESKTGAFYQQVSFYLKKNDFQAAIEKLLIWAEEIPTCKINGSWSILYARAYIRIKQYDRALREIETFIKICESSNPYYGWALYWKAEAYLAGGERKEIAKTIFLELVEKFPQSRVAEMARLKLQEIEK
ncbi:MAG: PKD domain-containing protein [Candidatus Omnitrophica bacterium]|nr:PKD domain-containing protein [Candidatus Omnitrophota bacterium]